MKLANLDFHLWNDCEDDLPSDFTMPENDINIDDRGSWGDGGVDGLI